MHQQSLILLHSKLKEKMHLQENTLFDLDPKVKVTRNVAQCPLHHVINPRTKFEVTTSKNFRRRTIYKKIQYLTLTQGHTKCCLVPSTSCDIFSYKAWSCYNKRFRRRCIYKKIQYLTFWPWGQCNTKHCPIPSTSCDLFSYKVWSCYVLPFRRYIYKKIHYLTLTLGSR